MELLIPLDTQSQKPLYEQIYAHIQNEIRMGALCAADRLPSTRVLADYLKVSRSTTQLAYEQLLAEGYIEARPCQGYFVSHIEELVVVEPGGVEEEAEDQESGREYLVDFSPRGIDLDRFPYNTWRKLTRNILTDESRGIFSAGNPQGELNLREAIRSYLHSARGVNCQAEQIVVGAGSEYLLMLLSQVLGETKTIAMENPTYKQAYRVFDSLGHRVIPIQIDENGMDAQLLEASDAEVAYVMPSHQYPTGVVMSVKRRQEMLRWAKAVPGRYLIEDDYDSEFRYKGKPIPALQGMDTEGNVIYLGTFSKSIAPAMRVSYMVLPRELLKQYRKRVGFYASTVSRIDQNILYQFLSQGHFERHLNRMRGIYKAKRDILLTAIRPLEEAFDMKGESAGLHILLTHRGGKSEAELIQEAASAGIRVYGLSGDDISEGQRMNSSTIIIGYARLREEAIERGIGLLIESWMK